MFSIFISYSYYIKRTEWRYRGSDTGVQYVIDFLTDEAFFQQSNGVIIDQTLRMTRKQYLEPLGNWSSFICVDYKSNPFAEDSENIRDNMQPKKCN